MATFLAQVRRSMDEAEAHKLAMREELEATKEELRELRGVMDERTGMDGKPYAIRFELRMPDDWQGRFMHQFNGGNDGAVVPALGEGTGVAMGNPALARGMAVVSSDAGHDGEANPEAGLAALRVAHPGRR